MNTLPILGAMIGLSIAATQMPDKKEMPRVWLASDVIGMKVVAADGESLGKIEDIVVRPSGDLSYAVLSFGGWLGMNDKLFALPWSVLRAAEPDTTKKDSDLSLILPVLKDRLKTAPGFDKKNWPNTANPDWAKDIDTFYAGDVNPNSKRPVEAAMRTTFISWRASELKGTNVTTPAGEKLGDIKELAIDANGRVSYATVSVGGFLGMGDRVVAVPWDSLKFTLGGEKADKKIITLASTKQQLGEAPEFKSGKAHAAEMCDPKWVGRVYAHYSCPVYWNSAPAAEPKTTPKG